MRRFENRGKRAGTRRGIFGGMGVQAESTSCRARETGLAMSYASTLLIRVWAVRSPEQVTERLDRLVDDIRNRYHEGVIGKPRDTATPSDVLIVAHGHILRAFAMRWIKQELTEGVALLLEGEFESITESGKGTETHANWDVAGGVGTLRSVRMCVFKPGFL